MQIGDGFTLTQTRLIPSNLIENTTSVFENHLVSVVSHQRNFVFFGKSFHIHSESRAKHVSVLFCICHKCALPSRVGKLPVKVKRQGNSCDTQLPTFEDDKEVNIIF